MLPPIDTISSEDEKDKYFVLRVKSALKRDRQFNRKGLALRGHK